MNFNDYLWYNPETGQLTWKGEPCVLKRVRGKSATSLHGEGYRAISVAGKMYLAHRVIWHMVHGKWPKEDLDHVNGDRSDNRLINLREASRQENLRNSRGRPHTSKYKGVSWDKHRNKWVAYCKAGEKVKNLGRYDNEEEAAMAYDNFVKENFGQFARLNHPALTPEAQMVA
jgi:hypothetical protein